MRTFRHERSAPVLGLTIIESLVAILILAVAMAAIIPVFTRNARVNANMELRSGAVSAAQSVLDDLRITQRDNWNGTWPSELTVTAGERTFSVDVSVCSPSDSGCLSTADAKHIRLEVSNGGTNYYEVETVFTRFD